MKLYFRNTGTGPCFVILHGLYGSSDNWLSIANMMKNEFEFYIPDLRNHGKSPHNPQMDYVSMKEDVIEFFADNNIEKAILLGHSMGGRIAIDFALNYPEKISHLIVADISPKPYKESRNFNMVFKHHQHIIKHLLSTPLEKMSGRKEIIDFLLMKLYDERLVNFLLKNLKRDKERGFYWTINLHAISNQLETILKGNSDTDYNQYFNTTGYPVLFLKGSLSSYLSTEDYGFIKQLFPYTEIEEIQNAGHWLHAEQPEIFTSKIREFIFK